jgi:hypothetical protein
MVEPNSLLYDDYASSSSSSSPLYTFHNNEQTAASLPFDAGELGAHESPSLSTENSELHASPFAFAPNEWVDDAPHSSSLSPLPLNFDAYASQVSRVSPSPQFPLEDRSVPDLPEDLSLPRPDPLPPQVPPTSRVVAQSDPSALFLGTIEHPFRLKRTSGRFLAIPTWQSVFQVATGMSSVRTYITMYHELALTPTQERYMHRDKSIVKDALLQARKQHVHILRQTLKTVKTMLSNVVSVVFRNTFQSDLSNEQTAMQSLHERGVLVPLLLACMFNRILILDFGMEYTSHASEHAKLWLMGFGEDMVLQLYVKLIKLMDFMPFLYMAAFPEQFPEYDRTILELYRVHILERSIPIEAMVAAIDVFMRDPDNTFRDYRVKYRSSHRESVINRVQNHLNPITSVANLTTNRRRQKITATLQSHEFALLADRTKFKEDIVDIAFATGRKMNTASRKMDNIILAYKELHDALMTDTFYTEDMPVTLRELWNLKEVLLRFVQQTYVAQLPFIQLKVNKLKEWIQSGSVPDKMYPMIQCLNKVCKQLINHTTPGIRAVVEHLQTYISFATVSVNMWNQLHPQAPLSLTELQEWMTRAERQRAICMTINIGLLSRSDVMSPLETFSLDVWVYWSNAARFYLINVLLEELQSFNLKIDSYLTTDSDAEPEQAALEMNVLLQHLTWLNAIVQRQHTSSTAMRWWKKEVEKSHQTMNTPPALVLSPEGLSQEDMDRLSQENESNASELEVRLIARISNNTATPEDIQEHVADYKEFRAMPTPSLHNMLNPTNLFTVWKARENRKNLQERLREAATRGMGTSNVNK